MNESHNRLFNWFQDVLELTKRSCSSLRQQPAPCLAELAWQLETGTPRLLPRDAASVLTEAAEALCQDVTTGGLFRPGCLQRTLAAIDVPSRTRCQRLGGLLGLSQGPRHPEASRALIHETITVFLPSTHTRTNTHK